MNALRTIYEALGTIAIVLMTAVAVLFGSDVLVARTWRWTTLLAGYAVMVALALLLRRRDVRLRFDVWVAGGLASVALCIACANLAWPLQNEMTGAFFSGRGVVNWVLLPWLHVALWIVGLLCLRQSVQRRP